MKKIAVAAFIAVLLFSFTACGSKTVEEDIWTVVSEDTVEPHEYTDIKYDDNGNVISKKDGYSVEITYLYNDNGLLIRKTINNVLYGVATNTYEYNEKGLVTREVERSEYAKYRDGLIFTFDYKFDNKDRVARMTIHSNVNDGITICDYTYDDNDKIISKTETDGKGSYSASTDYEYDENGNVIASHCKFSDGDTLDMSYTYEKTGTRKYDGNHIPVAEKYRHFRENYDK